MARWTSIRANQIVNALARFVASRKAVVWMRFIPSAEPQDIVNQLYVNLAQSPNSAALLAAAKQEEDVQKLVFKCAIFHLKNYALRTHHRRKMATLESEPLDRRDDIDLRLDLWHVLSALPRELREIANLRDQHLTIAEIAQRLQICTKTVNRRLKLIREILTSKLHLN